MSNIVFNVIPVTNNIEEIGVKWNELSSKTEHSFFLSWKWIGTWLKSLPSDNGVQFIVGEKNGRPVVMFCLGLVKGIQSKIIFANRGYLNSTGCSDLDNLTIEYNGLLIDPLSLGDLTACFSNTAFSHVDEFHFTNICSDQLDLLSQGLGRDATVHLSSDSSYYIDLEKVRLHDGDLLPLVGANSRSKIRRSIKLYEQQGPVTVEAASSVSECQTMLQELAKLHNEKWALRGVKGAFEDEYFVDFHMDLIKNCFEKGQVNVLHIKTPLATIGYLYNFNYAGNVLFYQSGFNYEGSSKLKPGYVCHYLASRYYAELGANEYDFLKGSSQYKKSLATDERKMHTIKSQRKKLRFKMERALRAGKKGLPI